MSLLGWLLLLKLLIDLAIFAFFGVAFFSMLILFLKWYIKERFGSREAQKK